MKLFPQLPPALARVDRLLRNLARHRVRYMASIAYEPAGLKHCRVLTIYWPDRYHRLPTVILVAPWAVIGQVPCGRLPGDAGIPDPATKP